ncbi:MAG: N-acetyltransferase family protein [Polyangiaceae bacterium]|jgi:ribosomal protein S18 acetylase RimI-like enzyme
MPRIRSYRPADWDSFLALDLETGLATLRQSPQEEKDAFAARWAVTLKTSWGWTDAGPTKDKSLLLVVDDDDGSYAGHLWLCEEVDMLSGATRLWVLTVAIVAKYRSRGWGRLLMERAVEEARARKLGSVGLSVAADNVVARKLYEEMGFDATRLSMFKTVR